MQMLKARLYNFELEKREKKALVKKIKKRILDGATKLDHTFYIHTG